MKNKLMLIIPIICVLIISMLFIFKEQNNIKISFNSNGGNEIKELSLSKGNKIILPIPTRDGYEFIGWYLGNKKIDENTLFNENSTYKAKYDYFIYDVNGGNYVSSVIYFDNPDDYIHCTAYPNTNVPISCMQKGVKLIYSEVESEYPNFTSNYNKIIENGKKVKSEYEQKGYIGTDLYENKKVIGG